MLSAHIERAATVEQNLLKLANNPEGAPSKKLYATYQNWLLGQQKKGHMMHTIVKALFAASGDDSLASELLRDHHHLISQNNLPDIPGVWTAGDDYDLLLGNYDLQRLDIKHGMIPTHIESMSP